MSKIDNATRKLEAFLFNGQMQDSGSEFGPCLDRWPRLNRTHRVNLENCTIIGHLSDDPETGAEVFTPNPELEDKDWVTIGTIHVDLENESETFTRNPELDKIKPD